MEKLVSVIIPAYNAEGTIERCINSINGENVEIIVVIDGSEDNTSEICEKLSNGNKMIKVIEQSNTGPYGARKKGIENAQGEYLMFLDADDYFAENTISRVKEVINKYNKPDLIRFRYEKVPDGYEQYRYMQEDEKEILKPNFATEIYPMFLNGYMLNSMWTNCVKRKIIQDIEIAEKDIKYGEDLLLNLEIFTKVNNVVFINDILYKYVYVANSLTNSRTIEKLLENLEDAIEVYSLLHTYLVRWNMNTKDNTEIVNNRIRKESGKIIKIIKEIKWLNKI